MTAVTDLVSQLKRDEGEVLHAYRDSRGILTAGVGHNCEAHSEPLAEGAQITQQQCDQWLQQDIDAAEHNLAVKLPWSADLDSVRLGVLVNMTFNLGIGGLLGFHNTLAMIQAGNYDGASEAMLESKWADQVGKEPPSEEHPDGGRAWRLSQQIKTGAWV